MGRYCATNRDRAKRKSGFRAVGDRECKNRSVISWIEADHIFEEVILAGAVGVASGAREAVGG